jgi:hypothetical protein
MLTDLYPRAADRYRSLLLFLTLIRVSPPAIGNILPPVEGERG